MLHGIIRRPLWSLRSAAHAQPRGSAAAWLAQVRSASRFERPRGQFGDACIGAQASSQQSRTAKRGPPPRTQKRGRRAACLAGQHDMLRALYCGVAIARQTFTACVNHSEYHCLHLQLLRWTAAALIAGGAHPPSASTRPGPPTSSSPTTHVQSICRNVCLGRSSRGCLGVGCYFFRRQGLLPLCV